MEKKKISLTSSAFLIDKSQLWDPLKKNYKLIFNDYRFYDKILNQNADFNVVILSFKDLINFPIYEISKKIEKNICKNILGIFSILKKKIIHSEKPLILFVDYYYGETGIKASQNFPIEETIITYIKNEIRKLFKFSNFFSVNLNNVSNDKNFFDDRLFYVSRSRHSIACLEYISKSIEKIIKRIQTTAKKVLILDCDNTLWGGVVGEDGPNGIKIGTDGEGAIFSDFQKSILRLKNEGVILCISSKNNKEDVLEVFKKNKNMLLKINDFSSIKTNWKQKSYNIAELSKELNLGLDSFVFFDDNPMEREQIRKDMPEVTVIHPNDDISIWPQQLFEYFEFIKFKITKEDTSKTKQYKNRLKFVREKNDNINEIAFLKKIKLNAKIISLNKSNEQRCLQIIEKTNQFNLTTKRYNLSQIRAFNLNKKNTIFMIELNDKYGKHGLVGLIMLRKEKNFIYIDNFAMSCRVLGRYLETWILSKVVEFAKKNKAEFIIGEYISSKKNILVKDLYKKMGFRDVKEMPNIPSNLKIFFNKNSNILIANIKNIKIKNSNIYLK